MVADYPFAKDRIFAYMNLSDDELLIYDKLYTMLEPQVPPADLVIYLEADVDTCMARIRRRQRPFERNMSQEYLAELIDAYNHYYRPLPALAGAGGSTRGSSTFRNARAISKSSSTSSGNRSREHNTTRPSGRV